MKPFFSKIACLDQQVYQKKDPAAAAAVRLDIQKSLRTGITCFVHTLTKQTKYNKHIMLLKSKRL